MALYTGTVMGFVTMLAVWFIGGIGEQHRVHRRHAAEHGRVRRDDLVRDAGLSFILLREEHARASCGRIGARSASRVAAVTIVVALVTLYFQLQDPAYRGGVYAVAVFYVLGLWLLCGVRA